MTQRHTYTQKNIALVAHDHKKQDLINWVKIHRELLGRHQIICTGTTGSLVEQELHSKQQAYSSKNLVKLKSGPLGGDQQLGAYICENKVDLLIFFWDPMEPHPHDVDVKALLRIAVLYNIPFACNESSADFLISSPLVESDYAIKQMDFTNYLNRQLTSE
jgi:methylglyoxal synthase